jgi:hypothetical protein
LQILDALFHRPNPDVLEITFDTDVAAKAQFMFRDDGKGLSPDVELVRAISEIRAGTIDFSSIRIAMSPSSIVAATSALRRARIAGQLGKGTIKRSTQRMAGILAMRSAAATAVTGSTDGVLGADPIVVERLCENLKCVFQNHGAVRLRSPLLRPQSSSSTTAAVGGPAELINPRGALLVLPEDLTASFGKSWNLQGQRDRQLINQLINRLFQLVLSPEEARRRRI